MDSSLIKYPRTPHLPWSPGATSDDKVLSDVSIFRGKQVVVTAKMDGENTTLTTYNMHARSVDYAPHPSRNWLRNLHASISYLIPEGWRICGENLFAKHSIHYTNLTSLFQVFSIWDASNQALSWKDTKEWTALFGLTLVPILYVGFWDEKTVKALYAPVLNGDPLEGYVVRNAEKFPHSLFHQNVAKYVRFNHVQTDAHWMKAKIVRNLTR